MSPLRLAIIVSHPIQHFCPQYVSFARNPEVTVKVFFGSILGYKPFADQNFKEVISWGNLNLDKFPHIFLNADKELPITAALDATSLDEELSLFKPGFIITYGYFQKLQRHACKWAKKNSIPIAYISDSELRQKRNAFKQLLKYPFIRWYLSRIDYFLTVGDENERYYQFYKVPSRKLLRMHFPIDEKLYKTSYEQRSLLRSRIREQYAINKDEIVLSVVGKLVSWKNQDHIIEAMEILERQGIYIHLFMVGSGVKMEEWKTKAKVLKKSRVHFSGFVSIDVLPEYYAASDIYVHPASAEPHSIAISEAIYMSCPVIVSDTCGSFGPTDDVQEEINGYVFRFGDIENLAELIKKVIINREKRESMGIYSHQLGVKHQYSSHIGVIDSIVKALHN